MKRHPLTIGLLVTLFITLLVALDGGVALARPAAAAGAPTIVSYQGQVTVGGVPHNGTGYCKFAIVDAGGATTYWSNAAMAGAQPGAAVSLTVTSGLFTVLLGDTSLANMAALPATAFGGTERYLRVWFSSDGSAFVLLAPDRRIAAVPYALQAQEALTAASAGDADTLDGQQAAAFWQLGGNAVGAGSNILGTKDGVALELRVGGAPALRLQPNTTSPNVVGGYSGNNVAAGVFGATIGGGGSNNHLNSVTASYGTVAGGINNTASGEYSFVAGGYNLAGGSYSFALGLNATASHNGSFVWADSTGSEAKSTAANQFIARASGGVWMYTNPGSTLGARLAPDATAWSTLSDRNVKENLAPVDARALLDRLAAIPISTWNYTAQDPSIRHIGPMAQDFNALLADLGGEGETYINTLDADGVALAAIQGLYAQNQALQAENAALRQGMAGIEARLAALEQGQ